MSITTIPCLRCSESFERNSRAPSKYCKPCRKAINVEKQFDRRNVIAEDQKLLREVAELLREHLDPSMYQKVEEYVQSLGVPVVSLGDSGMVADRMPEGSSSPGGSDDGTSTNYPDLFAQLEARRLEVIMHDWFKENPHWTEGMHDC